MTYSQFIQHFTANKSRIPAAELASIVRDARARSMNNRVDGPVFWDDLINRIETAISPRNA